MSFAKSAGLVLFAVPLLASAETILRIDSIEALGFKKGPTDRAYRTPDGVLHLKGDQRPWSAETFDVDPMATYTISGEFRAAPGTEPATLYVGFTQFNKGRLINSPPVNVAPYMQANVTTLAKDVAAGDRTIEIKTSRCWKAGEGFIAALGAKKDSSDLPNYRYTKGCVTNVVRRADGSATLVFDRPVGVTGQAGEGIREHQHGGNYHYAGCWNIPSTRDWTNIVGTVKGMSECGIPYDKWWHGAEKAGVLILANYRGGKDAHLEIRNLKVVKSDPPAVEYARTEFARLWQAVTGKTAPEVTIDLVTGETLPDWAKAPAAKVRDDGYALVARQGKLAIVAKRPRGCLYGVYDWFHRFAGARWYYPGKDGEKLPRNPELAVADCTIVDNPAFAYRNFNLVASYAMHETIDWMVRNRLQPPVGKIRQALNYIMPISARYDYRRYGAVEEVGGHIFSSLLSDSLFAEHPEYFAEVGGKRIPQTNEKHRWQAQPCATNPDGLRIMGEAVAKSVTSRPGIERLIILNNDCGGWCQCAECTRRFGKSESDRFWNIANTLSAYAKKANPDVMVDIHGYQTFQGPPKTVKPGKDADVNVCVHHRCYVHAVGDPACPYNERYRRIMRQWRALVHGTLGTYEYTNCLPGWGFLPIERTVYDDIAWYHELGCTKYIDEVLPLDGNSQGKAIPKDHYRGYAFLHYVQARALWDPKLDFDALFDEFCAFYYGAAAKPMKHFRLVLRKGLEKSGLYLCYGSKDDELWRCLPNEKVVKALQDDLAAAAAAVADDPVRKELVDFEARRFREVYLSKLPNRQKPHREIVNGRPEYLLNGDFEYGTAGWGGLKPDHIVTGDAQSGTNCLKGGVTIYQAPAFNIQTYCSVPVCDKVHVRGWYRGSGTIGGCMRLSDRSTNTKRATVSVSAKEWSRFNLDLDMSETKLPPLYVFLDFSKDLFVDKLEVFLTPRPGAGGEDDNGAYIPPPEEK